MEVIKRKILLEDSTDRTNEKTWGQMTATTFYLNVLITQTIDDMGLFTDIDFIENDKTNTIPDYTILTDKLYDLGLSFPFMSKPTPYFSTISTPNNLWNVLRFPSKIKDEYYNYTYSVITGITESRIEDVRTYDIANPFKTGFDMNKETYENYEGDSILGVDRLVSNQNPKIYVFDTKDDTYLGTKNQISGLYFEDYNDQTYVVNIDGEIVVKNKTIVRYIGEGMNETNTSLSAITKEEYLFGIISPPEVQNDVFIDRGINTVLDKHLRLSEITNIEALERYGNGFYKLNKQ